jgi:hypothetical protein
VGESIWSARRPRNKKRLKTTSAQLFYAGQLERNEQSSPVCRGVSEKDVLQFFTTLSSEKLTRRKISIGLMMLR